MADAKRENRTAVVEFLTNVISEKNQVKFCKRFENGILNKGIAYLIGIFHKKLADIVILTEKAKT